jgi:HEAT repeat protein
MQERILDLVTRLKHCRTLPEILEVCGAVGREKDLMHLLTEVLGSDETSVRWKAAVALTEIGPPAVQDLIGCLSDPRAWVRSSAAWVLGNIGDRRAAPALQRNLEDPSSDVRKEVSEALGKLVDKPGRLSGKNGTQGVSVPI